MAASNDEVIRLILELTGKDNVDALVASLGKLKTQVAAVDDSYELLHSEYEIIDKDLESFNHIIDVSIAESAKLEAAHKSLGNTARKSGGEITGAATAASRTINQLAYGLSDFASVQGTIAQRLNGAANNIQQMAVTMGASGGVFLAITGLITAVQLISSNWENLVGLFGETNTEKATEEVNKVTEALNKLNAAREKETSFRKRGEEQSERASAFHTSVGKFGGMEKIAGILSEAGLDPDRIASLLSKSGSGDKDAIDYLKNMILNDTDNRGKRFITGPLGKFGIDLARGQGNITERRTQEEDDQKTVDADQQQNERLLAKRKTNRILAKRKAAADAKKGERDDAAHVRKSQALGHAVGKAFDKGEPKPKDNYQHLPFITQKDIATGNVMNVIQNTQQIQAQQMQSYVERLRTMEQRGKGIQTTLRRGNR